MTPLDILVEQFEQQLSMLRPRVAGGGDELKRQFIDAEESLQRAREAIAAGNYENAERELTNLNGVPGKLEDFIRNREALEAANKADWQAKKPPAE